jgi:MFS transporter, DHA1 family, multidrug resistance protein
LLESRYIGPFWRSIGKLAAVAKNPGFASLLRIFSLLSFSGMAFIASSSYIFIDSFGLSEKLYSLYFAFNAIGLIAGPALYLCLSRILARRYFIMAGFICPSAARMLVYLFGDHEPWMFAACLFPVPSWEAASGPLAQT